MFIPVRNIKSINPFRWNVELRLRLTGLNYRINFAFTQTWRYNTKLHGPNKRMGKNKKWDSLVLIRACFCMIGRYHGIPCFHFFFFFLFRSNGKNEHLDENDFRHGYGNYFKSAVLKVTWFQLCSKFFLRNYKAPWQRYLKYTLQLKILRT